jgi:uncharacterized protein
MRNGFKIVDTDAHMMEPEDMWERYIEDRYKSEAPRMQALAPGGFVRKTMVEGEPVQRETGKYPTAMDKRLAHIEKKMERFKRAKSAGFNAPSRLVDMDELGVDVQILFPTVTGSIVGREFRDTKLLAACCRAYNNWAAEYVSANPQRLRWVTALPMQDVEEAITEVQRAAKLGCSGHFVRPNPVGGRSLWHDDYAPLWKEIEKTGKPVATHDVTSSHLPSYGDRMETNTSGHILSHPFEAMSAMAGLIWFGVVEKCPRLQVVQVEADAGWVPYWLQRMDQHWHYIGPVEHPFLTMTPTEYFKRNFCVGFRGDERTIKAAVDLVGDDNFTWDTDYPHPDGSFPWGIDNMLQQPIADVSKRKILWDNAARVFGLN